ncbi:hypothetical protein M8J77_019254 [Diaphorina citri]|nr:hypothetical protein M8J77_019254 [Diaphorina citri]
MLKSRIIITTLHEETVILETTRGCPQGGVLSPILWTLVVDSLLVEQLNENGYLSLGYADDIVILILGKYMDISLELMQHALAIVENWCNNERLRVNPEKTTIIPFTRRLLNSNVETPTLFGTKLAMANEVKYLGVTLDKKLTWNCHIKKIADKAQVCMNTCRRAFGKIWGLNPKMVHWMYTMITRPLITYGALVWPKIEQVTAKAKLNRIQRQACLGITGAMSTTPSLALDAILDLPPLDIYIKGMARAASYRLECNKTWKPKNPQLGHPRINSIINDERLHNYD